MTDNTMSEKPETLILTQHQRQVLQSINDFLQQFSDREQMQAAAYLAKYKGVPTCEETSVPLRWALQKEFNNVG